MMTLEERIERLERLFFEKEGADARAARELQDMLYNLDDDNFAVNVIKEKQGMKTQIKQTADSIELVAQDVSGLSAELEITAGRITQEVTDRTNADAELQSSITQTAEAITSEVTARQSADSALSSQITQTANSIRTEVRRVYAIKEYSSASAPSGSFSKEYVWKNIYYEPERYYVYNDVTGSWQRIYPGDPELKSAFIQTASGFKLDGTVRIKGDLITEGTISGVVIDVDTDATVGKVLRLIDSSEGSAGLGGTISIFDGSVPTFLFVEEGNRYLRLRSGDTTLELRPGGKTYINGVEWSPYAKFA